MLAIVAAVLFGIGFVCAAFIHGTVPAVIDPGFMWLGLCLLALHLVWPLGPWHRPPP